MDDDICAYAAWATAQMEPTDNMSKGINSRETVNACYSNAYQLINIYSSVSSFS